MGHDKTGPFKTEPARYSPEDFVLWTEKQILELTPKFQRRGVWRTPAKSFLIDTMLREMTIPPLYLRMTQNETRTKTIREVVDGQQRVRAVLDFISEKFRLSSTLNAEWAGKYYSQLKPDEQQRIMDYSFSFEIFRGISDEEVLEVFCRLNMNGIPLNNQELRNGKYFGLFKQTCYKLAIFYLPFWRHHKLFTERGIARMQEVELTSELVIAGRAGMQDKKRPIDTFYRDFEESYPGKDQDEKRFKDTMATISETFNGELAESAFRRPPLFYTLYCVVFHHLFGLPEIQRQSPRRKLTSEQRSSLREAVEKLSGLITESKEDPTFAPPKKYVKFLAACARQTDNIAPRKIRFNSLYDEAF
jgi:hypothetical protein